MLLDKFRMLSGTTVLREVIFKQGLNLVIDAPTTSRTDSGNNVGKTTFLRCIDYCLGSDGTTIYIDKESKNPNKPVLEFLKSKLISFELTLKRGAEEFKIYRPWEGTPEINDMPFASDFPAELNKIIFGIHERKPSFRQLIGKFVRIESHQTTRVLKFLYGGGADEYDPIYLCLFGFTKPEVLVERYVLVERLTSLLANRDALKNVPKKEIQERIRLVNHQIGVLQERIKSFEVAPSVTNEIAQLTDLRDTVSQLSVALNRLGARVNLNKATLQSLHTAR